MKQSQLPDEPYRKESPTRIGVRWSPSIRFHSIIAGGSLQVLEQARFTPLSSLMMHRQMRAARRKAAADFRRHGFFSTTRAPSVNAGDGSMTTRSPAVSPAETAASRLPVFETVMARRSTVLSRFTQTTERPPASCTAPLGMSTPATGAAGAASLL